MLQSASVRLSASCSPARSRRCSSGGTRSLSCTWSLTAAMVSAAATSSVRVLPAGVLTKICMSAAGHAGVAAATAAATAAAAPRVVAGRTALGRARGLCLLRCERRRSSRLRRWCGCRRRARGEDRAHRRCALRAPAVLLTGKIAKRSSAARRAGEARTASCSCHCTWASCRAEPFGACECWRRGRGACVGGGGARATVAAAGLGCGGCADAALHSNAQKSSTKHKCAPPCASRGAGWSRSRSHADQQHQRASASRSVLALVGRVGRPLPGGAPSPEPVIDGLTPRPSHVSRWASKGERTGCGCGVQSESESERRNVSRQCAQRQLEPPKCPSDPASVSVDCGCVCVGSRWRRVASRRCLPRRRSHCCLHFCPWCWLRFCAHCWPSCCLHCWLRGCSHGGLRCCPQCWLCCSHCKLC